MLKKIINIIGFALIVITFFYFLIFRASKESFEKEIIIKQGKYEFGIKNPSDEIYSDENIKGPIILNHQDREDG